MTSKHDGPIFSVLAAVGEYRSHSMMSHGANAWVTHSTMRHPGNVGWPDACSDGPIRANELREGFPGLAQVNQGAIYTFLYYNEQDYDPPDYLRYQLASSGDNLTKAEQTADWLWLSSAYQWHSDGFYRVGVYEGSTWYPQPYVLYQYKHLGWRNYGYDNQVWLRGGVCSTTIAWAFNKARGNGERIDAFTYSHTEIVDAGNALYNSIYNGCSNWIAAVACFESICDDAARQMRNCMSTGVCNSDDNDYWNSVANNSSSSAVALSPDDIGGWGGHCWYDGQTNCRGNGSNYTSNPASRVGPWAPYGSTAVQFNAGGNTYGCWF